jgi:hypothetical protein
MDINTSRYAIGLEIPVTKKYDYDFSCDSKEFMESFSEMLTKFFTEHNGKILIKESKIQD